MSKPSRFPHTLVLIFALVIVAQFLTYALPAGKYIREPRPEKGKPYVEKTDARPLRERLATARRDRHLKEEDVAKAFQVSKRTLMKWEAGPPEDGDSNPSGPGTGTHIEANVGKLIDRWITDGQTPSAGEIESWKAVFNGGRMLVPGSYHTVETEPLTWVAAFTAFTSVPVGLGKAADIIFFVFLIGGVLGIMRATGAFDALIGTAIRAFGNRALPLVLGTTGLFAVASGMIGMAEEYVPFIALLVTMSLAMKLDAMVGISIVLVGYAVGYGCAPANPFTVLVAQSIADLPKYSGWPLRTLLIAVGLVIGVHHILRYAARVKADPSRSLVADIDYSTGFELPEDIALTLGRRLVLAAFALAIVLVVYGCARYEWEFPVLSAVFLGLGFVTPILVRMSPNDAAAHFCTGAAELTTTALLIGFARTIEVVLVDGQVIDTVVHSIAGLLSGMGEGVGAVGMLLVQTFCNFFVPSGSGQAYVTMPIMAPLADELGIQRQVAVLAYQFGDGFTNVITPTNAAFMGMLAMARVPYERWLRFAIPLMIKLYLLAAIALVAAVYMGYS